MSEDELNEDAPARVTAIHIAKATRLPMRAVDRVDVEAGKVCGIRAYWGPDNMRPADG